MLILTLYSYYTFNINLIKFSTSGYISYGLLKSGSHYLLFQIYLYYSKQDKAGKDIIKSTP